jgi:LysM repeat protein
VLFKRTSPPPPAPPPPAPTPPAKRKWFGWGALAALALFAVLTAACKDRRLLDEGSSTTAKPSKTTATSAPATAVTRPATTVATTIAVAGSDYIVQPGDTIVGITKKTGVSVAAILSANNLTDPNRIAAGQTLRIPVPTAGATTAPGSPTTPSTQVATASPATTFPPGTQTSIVTITVVVTIPPTTKP